MMNSEFQKPITGNFTAVAQSVDIASPNNTTQIVQITGTWVGTLVLEGSNDGITYQQLITLDHLTGLLATSLTTNGFYVFNSNAFQFARIRSSAWTSGSASITIYGSDAATLLNSISILRGGTDGSIIGNVGDKLKITGSITSGVADQTSFVYGTTFFDNIGGVFQDTSPTLTAGQSGALRLNANRAVHTILRDPTTDAGVTTDNNGNANKQRLHVAVPDTTTANSTLNALNTNVTIAMSGLAGCGFQINAGTLAATLTPYLSMDGGTTWQATNFYDPVAASILSTITVTNPNAFKLYMIITLGGTSNVKVEVTSYTSGSATASLRASLSGNVSITPAGAGGGAAAFSTITNTTPSIPNNAATLIKAANSARKYLMISNPSGSLAYIALGNTTGLTTSQGIPIPARSFWEIKGDNLFTGPVYAISSSAITFYLSEGTP